MKIDCAKKDTKKKKKEKEKKRDREKRKDDESLYFLVETHFRVRMN